MSTKPTKALLFGRVDEDGRLKLDLDGAFAIACVNLRGREIQLTIEPKRKGRSNSQNAYYHGVVLSILSDWSGYTAAEIHGALKAKFLSVFDAKKNMQITRSTSDLSTVEYEAFLSDVRQWAAEQGQFIPLPNEEIY